MAKVTNKSNVIMESSDEELSIRIEDENRTMTIERTLLLGDVLQDGIAAALRNSLKGAGRDGQDAEIAFDISNEGKIVGLEILL